MSVELVPVREAFPPGAWERACVDAARRRMAGWRADLADGSALYVEAVTEARATVRIHGRGPAVLWLVLDNPAAWWPTAPGWETSDWRDVLLLQALQPVLAGLNHWIPGSEPWLCEWCGTPEPQTQTWSLGLRWSVADETRQLSLHWPSATEAVSQWAACGAEHSYDENEDEGLDGDQAGPFCRRDQETNTSRFADEPTTEVRVCVAALHLSQLELSALKPGGGLVLGELSPSEQPLWLRAGTRWLLVDAESHGEASPDASLRAVPEDGALCVLSAPRPVSPGDMAERRINRLSVEGQDCTLWLQGRAAGQGRLLEHDGLALVRITDWQA